MEKHPQGGHLGRNSHSDSGNGEDSNIAGLAPEHRNSLIKRSFFYAGCGYLSGAIFGTLQGVWGCVRYGDATDSVELKVNRILNMASHKAKRVGGRLAMLGLCFAGFESGVVHFRGIDDGVSSVVAGVGTGAAYKAAAGPRVAIMAGAMGGALASLAIVGKNMSK